MTTVLVEGWETGFEKVGFTLLLQSALGYRLSVAKRTTDAIVDDEVVEIQVSDAEAETVLTAMRNLGARCHLAVPTR